MNTQILDATQPGAIAQAAVHLREGHLVVFPTDTVYGVGSDAFNETAVEELYVVKGRPLEKGIPILLSDGDALASVARSVPEMARELMARFWPGPLTLIVPKRPELPAKLSPNENVAVRMPDNDVARTLIGAAGGAVAATSANRSGDPPARTAQEAEAALGGQVAAILDGGPAPHGVPSTILDCTTTPPAILRPGPIPAKTLTQFFPDVA